MIRNRVRTAFVGITEICQKRRNLLGPCPVYLSRQQTKQSKDFDESRTAYGIGDDGKRFAVVLDELIGIERILIASSKEVGGILTEKVTARIACAKDTFGRWFHSVPANPGRAHQTQTNIARQIETIFADATGWL